LVAAQLAAPIGQLVVAKLTGAPQPRAGSQLGPNVVTRPSAQRGAAPWHSVRTNVPSGEHVFASLQAGVRCKYVVPSQLAAAVGQLSLASACAGPQPDLASQTGSKRVRRPSWQIGRGASHGVSIVVLVQSPRAVHCPVITRCDALLARQLC
jgi:hypothetical protein